MRRPLALLILLCSPLTALRLAAQIDRGLPNEQIRINQATFDSAPNLPPSAREKIVAELRSVFFDSPAGAVDLAQKITRRRYQENGYHDARVTADSHRVFDDGMYVWYDLQVHVASEGVQYRLKNIAFARNTAIRSEQLRPMISLEPGAIFKSTALVDGITAVRHAYHDKGYVNVAIFPRLEFDPKRPDISVLLDIDEGPVFTFDNVAVAGVPIEQVKAFVDVLSAWHGQIMTPRVLEHMFASLKPILPPCADPMRNSTPRFKEKTAQVTLVLDFQECGTNSLDPNKPAVNCCPQ